MCQLCSLKRFPHKFVPTLWATIRPVMHNSRMGRINLSSNIKKIRQNFPIKHKKYTTAAFWGPVQIRQDHPSPFCQQGWNGHALFVPALLRLPLYWNFNYANEFLASNCTWQFICRCPHWISKILLVLGSYEFLIMLEGKIRKVLFF